MSFRPGDTIGDFSIVRKLRKGGMATLYLAERAGVAGFSKHVAIKVVHPHLAHDQYFIDMFLDEARLSARIQHPNCVHIEQLGVLDDTYYLVMEFVHSCSLGSLLKELRTRGRRLSKELSVHIALAVAEGLHGAHETKGPGGEVLGVVHRDVSPENVLLAFQGHVKLIDFGIAQAKGRISNTARGTIKGKFRYMSPEQAYGSEVDLRSDIYSLGIVLWEMLTGQRLFNAADQWILLEQVRNPVVEPPSGFHEEIPVELDKVVLRALNPNPDLRYSSAHEFRRELAMAVPSAHGVGALELSELLQHVMAARIQAESHLLPAEVAFKLDSKSVEEDEALKTFTIAIDDILMSEELGTPSDPLGTALGEGPSGLISEVSSADPGPRRRLPTLTILKNVGGARNTEDKRRRLLTGAVGTVGLIGIAATMFALMGGGAEEPDSKALAPMTAQESPAAQEPTGEALPPAEPSPEAPSAPTPDTLGSGTPTTASSPSEDAGTAQVGEPEKRERSATKPRRRRTTQRRPRTDEAPTKEKRGPVFVEDVF